MFYRKMEMYKPRNVVFLGKAAFQVLSGLKTIPWGLRGYRWFRIRLIEGREISSHSSLSF
jgi:hypothetical protein